MKLAFTTLGCPEWDLPTIVGRAVEYGYDGVDFRGYRGRIPLPELPEFAERAAESAALLREAGLEVPCMSSSARIAGDRDEALAEIRAYAELCRAFGAPFLRVFGGGEFDEDQRARAAIEAVLTLRRAAEIAEEYDLTIVWETHDRWISAVDIYPVIANVDSPRVGLLWDVHHPFRMAGERPADTWNELKPWIKYTHWKDSRPDPEAASGYRLCLMGEGDLPLEQTYHLLAAGGYDGWLTLEWEKKWVPELEEPEVAFPQFVEYMRRLM